MTEKPDLLIDLPPPPPPSAVNPDAKKCAKCHQPIDGAYLNADGKPYHDKCLTCSFCHKKLQSFVRSQLAIDALFCMEHAHLANPMLCGVCGEHIKAGEQYARASLSISSLGSPL